MEELPPRSGAGERDCFLETASPLTFHTLPGDLLCARLRCCGGGVARIPENTKAVSSSEEVAGRLGEGLWVNKVHLAKEQATLTYFCKSSGPC